MWIKSVVGQVIAWFGSAAIQKVVKSIPAIVKRVEADYAKATQDGIVTNDERKKLAMATIEAAVDEFGGKLSPIMRWAISWIVDAIAKKLPSKDLNIDEIVNDVKKRIGAI